MSESPRDRQKVKTEFTNGFWFIGTYSDDFPDSDKIVITNKKMALIAPKSECVLADSTGEGQSNIPGVIKLGCSECGEKLNKDKTCPNPNCKNYDC